MSGKPRRHSTVATCLLLLALAGAAVPPPVLTARAADRPPAARSTDGNPAADATPPETTITAAPAARTGDAEAAFAYAASEQRSTFECALDGAGFRPCQAAGQRYRGLAAGRHVFRVRAIDAAGNADPTPAAHAWRVEAAEPAPEPTPIAFADGFEGGDLAGWTEAMWMGSRVEVMLLGRRGMHRAEEPRSCGGVRCGGRVVEPQPPGGARWSLSRCKG